MINLDELIIDTVIELYYNGVSEKLLNTKYPKKLVAYALHSNDCTIKRTRMELKKRRVLIKHFIDHGVSGLIGGNK